MRIAERLSELFDKLWHLPSDPVPEIRHKLEEKGYRFEVILPPAGFSGMGMPGAASLPLYSVFNRAGEKVAYNRKDHEASQQYRADYDEAFAAYKAARKSPAPR